MKIVVSVFCFKFFRKVEFIEEYFVKMDVKMRDNYHPGVEG